MSILASLEGPVHLEAIHVSLEETLGRAVSRVSLKDCLGTQSMRKGSQLRRTRRGWYRLR